MIKALYDKTERGSTGLKFETSNRRVLARLQDLDNGY